MTVRLTLTFLLFLAVFVFSINISVQLLSHLFHTLLLNFVCDENVYDENTYTGNLIAFLIKKSEYMKINLPLPQEKKLTVLFRLEPGCLGPDGKDHIDKFCQLAQKKFASLHSDFVYWDIVPRNDKSLPEMQYKINNKNLSHDKVAKFLDIFHKNLDEFEDHMHKKLAVIIEQYLGR